MTGCVLLFHILLGFISDVQHSMFLKNASISFNGSVLTVECEFYNVQDVSCVLVGHRKSNITLLVLNTTSTLTVPIDDDGNYTFAIFGKNATHIDEMPVVVKLIDTSLSASNHEGNNTIKLKPEGSYTLSQ